MEKNKNGFYLQNQLFFDSGLMRVIYDSEELCVCNIANQCYAIFDYQTSNGVYFGMYANSNMIRRVVDSPIHLYEMIQSMDDKTLSSFMFELNENSFRIFQENKIKNDVNGPSRIIDFGFEEEMMKLSNDKGRNR